VRISDRYIGRHVLTGTFMAVFLLMIIFIMGALFKEIREQLVTYQAPLDLVVKIMLYNLPYPIMFVLPWGFLVAILLTLGRLSTQNELVGFRTSGTSLFRLAFPIFALGVLFSISCWFLSGIVSPHAKVSTKKLERSVLRDPVSLLSVGTEAKIPGSKILVTSKEGSTLNGFHLYSLSSSDRDAVPETYVYAESVSLTVDNDNHLFNLSFDNAFIEQIFRGEDEDSATHPIVASTAEPWPVPFPSGKISDRPSHHSTPALLREMIHGREEDKVETSDPEILAERKKRVIKVHRELQKRHALSLACLSFAFIGIPLGITSQRRESSSGLIVSLIVIGLYFTTILIAEDLDEQPWLCALTMWLPNIVCISLGIHLMRRASRR